MSNNVIKIALYNHKGGVGKTVLTANIASRLAGIGKKVLIVDSDPQANLTSYFIQDDVVDSLLDESELKTGRTLWSAMRPIVNGDGDYNLVKPYDAPGVENLSILPGDIRLAEFEVLLWDFWRETLDRRVRGFKGTTAISRYLDVLAESFQYDFIFYDTGPNIGPLNKTILLDCDYFIIPAACDLFSRRALKTLGHALSNWIGSWKTISLLAPKDIYLLKGHPKFLGYIPQRFKVYGGNITSLSSNYISQIEKTVFSDVINVLNQIDPSLVPKTGRGTRLGEVKDYATLVQEAQKQGVPLYEVKGGTQSQKDSALKSFTTIANNIIKKTSEA